MSKLTEKQLSRREKVSAARNDFHAMDDYSRGCLAQTGTAFTTYEDNGDIYCAELNRLAKQWRSDLEKATSEFREMNRKGVPLLRESPKRGLARLDALLGKFRELLQQFPEASNLIESYNKLVIQRAEYAAQIGKK